MTTIENQSFKITVGASIAVVIYMVYASVQYGQWTQKIENRIERIESAQQMDKIESEKDRNVMDNLQKKIASQDVTLAEIKKDVSQILFEIRKK